MTTEVDKSDFCMQKLKSASYYAYKNIDGFCQSCELTRAFLWAAVSMFSFIKMLSHILQQL